MCLTSHERSTVVLLKKGHPITSREYYSEDANCGNGSHNTSVTSSAL